MEGSSEISIHLLPSDVITDSFISPHPTSNRIFLKEQSIFPLS